MFDGKVVAEAIQTVGITHIVWIPDSVLGTWESELTVIPNVTLIRVCREGEAFAIAAGLHIGGKKPLILLQCTGLFEAGDALRNVIHDMQLPLFFLVGVRSYQAHQQGKSKDNCPVFTEPILKAWQIPHRVYDAQATATEFCEAYRSAQQQQQPFAFLLAE